MKAQPDTFAALVERMPAHQIHPREWLPGLVGDMVMELDNMTPHEPSGQLIRAAEADVAAWFREAWPGRQSYPNKVRNWAVATRINIIVDRANARSVQGHSADALRERREHIRVVRGKARALERALRPISEHHLSVREMLYGPEGVGLKYFRLAEEIADIEEMERTLDAFLTRELPSLHDHDDDIVWIGNAAKKAWTDTPSGHREKKPPLGLGPYSPLVGFVRLALEGIGLAGESRRGSSHEAISDHLRGRQNRKRDRKGQKKGANRSGMPLC